MRVRVALESPAHEMAQEEIQKQVAYLSPHVRNVVFSAEGAVLECDVDARERLQRIAVACDHTQLAGRGRRRKDRVELRIVGPARRGHHAQHRA